MRRSSIAALAALASSLGSPGVHHVSVEHDPDCRLPVTGRCTCASVDVRVEPLTAETFAAGARAQREWFRWR